MSFERLAATIVLDRPKLYYVALAMGRRAIIVLVTFASLIGSAAASPLDLFGYGGRSPGLAGTGVATATDFDSVYLNPAGLADAPAKRLHVGGLYGDFDLAMDGVDTDTESARGIMFGGSLPLPLGGFMRDRVGIGVGLYAPTRVLNRVRNPLPGAPTMALLESRSHVLAFQTALGLRLGSGWRVGAGLLGMADLTGKIDVTIDPVGRFVTRSEQELVTKLAPVVGARYLAPSGAFNLGLTAHAPSGADYDILVTADVADAVGLTLPPIRIAGTSQYDPLTVALESAWWPRPALLVAAQLSYQRWSAFPLPTLNPTPEGSAPQEPHNFHDTVIPRLALEWSLRSGDTELALRAGYFFFWSPAPEMDGRHSLLDSNRHIGSAGLGVAWPGRVVPLRIDVWMQGHALTPRTHTKDPAHYAPGEEMPYDTIRTSGHILVGGVTVGVDL